MLFRFVWRALKARYRNQAPELRAIRANIRPGDLVCDIGANKGSYLYWMSRWAGRVVAFEPQPGLSAYLIQVCAGLKMTNVTIEMKGVSDRSGDSLLFLPSVDSPEASLIQHGEATSIPVAIVSLDDYFAPDDRIGLMKIDVEGGELDVLKGAVRILRQHRPVLVFEAEQRHLREGKVADAFAFLADLGYEGWFIRGDAQVPIEAFDPSVDQSETGEAFWRSPAYCNNFVFRPRA
jgi:FkbM family methyltransferase